MEAVVLVHGLWVNGTDMTVLRRRLVQAGYTAHQFSYPSVREPPAANAMALQSFVRGLDGERLHFVGHSLGGIVIRHLFNDYPGQRPGRVVTLGTPHRPSTAAVKLARWLPGRFALGESVRQGLLGGLPPWPADRDLGSIAGTLRMGLGMVIPDIPSPNDGTVALEETRIPTLKDHVTLPVSHFGLLLSRRVFHEVDHFLKYGRFRNSDARATVTPLRPEPGR
jgi:pimeloyl-ACP methyl ester carboxylesterase